MEVYELGRIVDNPLFEGFGYEDAPSLLGRSTIGDDFFPEDSCCWEWTIEPLSKIWKPLVVLGRVRSFNDYPKLALLIPAFSRRAVDALQDFLEPNGEALPLIHPAGEYYAYNCRTIVEILNHDKTVANWSCVEPRMASNVRFFSIYSDRLTGLTIFRMREMPNRVFVTSPFVERVNQTGLNGFHFKKVWPFPVGIDYWMEDKKSRKAATQIHASSGSVSFKAQSLVLRLTLAGPKLSKDEKKRIAFIEDELDAQLFTPSLESPFFGCLEGKKTSKGVTTLFLSCPDSEKLYEILSNWLESLRWTPRPTVVLRKVPFDDFGIDGKEIRR
ncbi:MAG: hypothetical protein WCI02_10475 [Planctomycetota bacterium]